MGLPQPTASGSVRGECPRCHGVGREAADPHSLKLYSCSELPRELIGDFDLVCSFCYREAAMSPRLKVETRCDDCGELGAFRDPMGRRNEYRCSACHAKNGYIPGERSIITRVMSRESQPHELGRKVKCMLRDNSAGTRCRGQIKQRGKIGEICDGHWGTGNTERPEWVAAGIADPAFVERTD